MYGFFKNKRIVLYDTLIQQVRKRSSLKYTLFPLWLSFMCVFFVFLIIIISQESAYQGELLNDLTDLT